jgi:hypothetical protein
MSSGMNSTPRPDGPRQGGLAGGASQLPEWVRKGLLYATFFHYIQNNARVSICRDDGGIYLKCFTILPQKITKILRERIVPPYTTNMWIGRWFIKINAEVVRVLGQDIPPTPVTVTADPFYVVSVTSKGWMTSSEINYLKLKVAETLKFENIWLDYMGWQRGAMRRDVVELYAVLTQQPPEEKNNYIVTVEEKEDGVSRWKYVYEPRVY